jgi:hypothetical protein
MGKYQNVQEILKGVNVLEEVIYLNDNEYDNN